MMKMSTHVRYGLRAAVELALQRAWKGSSHGPVPLLLISKLQGIPEPFLRQIFHTLKRRRLVDAVMGKTGGYRLVRDPRHLTAHDFAIALGEDMLPVPCLRGPNVCKRIKKCPTNKLWCQVADLLRKALKRTTIAHLADRCPGRGRKTASVDRGLLD